MITTENVQMLVESYKKNIERLQSYKDKNRNNDFSLAIIEAEISLYECVIQDLQKLNEELK